MGYELMYCTNCHDVPPWSEDFKDHCPLCKAKGTTIELVITAKEWGNILKISKDDDFLLDMDKLKRAAIVEVSHKLAQMSRTTTPTKQTNVPKCLTCGSTNIKKISATKRYVSTGLFGLASSDLGHTQQCNDCGYKW